jgi:hypothetical protein
VGVKVGEGVTVSVELEVGEDVAVEVGDMVLEVGEIAAAEACTELGRSVGGTAVGVGVMVAVGGRGVAEGVGVISPPPFIPSLSGGGERGGCACVLR